MLLSANNDTITHSYSEEKGGFFLTQAFTEKCIVRASKRKGFAAPACGAAGGGAADLELEPTHDMYELSCQTQSMKSLDLTWLVKVQYILPELRALTLSLDAEGEDLMSGLLG